MTDPLVLIFSRNAFYRRLHLLALGAFTLCVIVIAILISLLVYLLRNPTHPLYFATDKVGRLIQVIPVNAPNMSAEDVYKWTAKAVQDANSYDYINYRSQLQNAENYFTAGGWQNYMNALNASNNLLGVIQRKQIVTAQVVSPPTIIAEGLLGGAYAWKYAMQLLVTYSEPPYDDQHKFSNAWHVEVVVQRQQALQGDKGLGIVQMVITQAGSNQPQEISSSPNGP